MKHLLRVLFALLAIFAITACAHDNEATEEDENEMPTEDEIQRLIEQAKRGKIPGGYEEPEEPATTEEAFDTMRCMVCRHSLKNIIKKLDETLPKMKKGSYGDTKETLLLEATERGACNFADYNNNPVAGVNPNDAMEECRVFVEDEYDLIERVLLGRKKISDPIDHICNEATRRCDGIDIAEIDGELKSKDEL